MQLSDLKNLENKTGTPEIVQCPEDHHPATTDELTYRSFGKF